MKTKTMTTAEDRRSLIRILGLTVLAVILATALAVAPSFARMGGGNGGGSGADGGSGRGSMGGSGSMDRDDGPGGRMEASQGAGKVDVGDMPAIRTGDLGSGDMTLEIRPVKYSDGRLKFRYSANTHSVSLSGYDLMELASLEADGAVYSPVLADPMRGHHASGSIVFELPGNPESFRLVIRGIPRVQERHYDWN